MSYTLPNLPYAPDTLEPHIDAKTMEIHHGKHHNAYVSKLNAALEGQSDLASQKIEDLIAASSKIPEKIRAAVLKNGGQHFNHSFLWNSMSPEKSQPSEKLMAAIEKDLAGLDALKEKFSQAAATQFGSGWAWLYLDGKTLKIASTANHENPLMDISPVRGIPLLVIDVWEHAYYLKYQNRRPEYIAAFLNVVNWQEVSRRFEAAGG